MRCPAGYLIRKIDENVYECDGGSHRYRMDANEIIIDKFGQVLLKNDKEADKKEHRR